VLNWLAGQDDMLALFRQYDAAPKDDKPRYDPYRHNAARLYNIPLADVEKFPHRQTGKFQELGCGYGMGAKKAVSAAKDVYGLTITPDQAKEIVDSYRTSHGRVVDFWYESEHALIAAVQKPGTAVAFGARKNLRAVKAGSYLYLILPSGRPLCYAAPRVVERPTPWGELKPCVEVSGQNSLTRKWERIGLYGGLIVENIVQAVSRDLLVHGMMEGEQAGYLPVLSVHDEAVVEVPEGWGSVAEYERILATVPAWAEGCPVAAEGWRGKRYRK
jgi:DNA polymerase